MRMGGPREAVWHAIIRRNHGANHLIVGRDHAGPGNDSNGNPIYGPYDAQQLVEKYSDELGVTAMLPFQMLVICRKKIATESTKVSKDTKTASISGTQVREQYLHKGKQLPGWFTRPRWPKSCANTATLSPGCCIWFTGLHNAGKSTTANILTTLLQEYSAAISPFWDW